MEKKREGGGEGEMEGGRREGMCLRALPNIFGFWFCWFCWFCWFGFGFLFEMEKT